MDNIIKALPFLVSLLAKGGDLAAIVKLVSEVLGRIQGLLPAPTIDVLTAKGVQEALIKLGYDPGPIDGKYGEKTKLAVYEFQKEHPPLVADGWCGVKTTAAIVEALG